MLVKLLQDCVLITLTTTHVPAILALREETVTLTSTIASHRHVSTVESQIILTLNLLLNDQFM